MVRSRVEIDGNRADDSCMRYERSGVFDLVGVEVDLVLSLCMAAELPRVYSATSARGCAC